MSNVLIVSAHPCAASFNQALVRQAKQVFELLGWTVTQSNLYQMNFNPLLGPMDVVSDSHSQLNRGGLDSHYSLTKMQMEASQKQQFNEDIQIEQSKLMAADLVVMQFPIWWGSFPAMMKGWIERVCSYGFAYGDEKRLSGKRLLLSATTGGAANGEEFKFYHDKIKAMGQEVFGYMDMYLEDSFIAHGPASIDSHSRDLLLAEHKKTITLIGERRH